LDGDFGDVVAAGEFRRQSRNAADLFQSALFRVVGETRCGRIQLADDERICRWGKDRVARPGPGFSMWRRTDCGPRVLSLRQTGKIKNLIKAQTAASANGVGGWISNCRVGLLPLFTVQARRCPMRVLSPIFPSGKIEIQQAFRRNSLQRGCICRSDRMRCSKIFPSQELD